MKKVWNRVGVIFNLNKGKSGATSILCDKCIKDRESLWTKNNLIWKDYGQSELPCEECVFDPAPNQTGLNNEKD